MGNLVRTYHARSIITYSDGLDKDPKQIQKIKKMRELSKDLSDIVHRYSPYGLPGLVFLGVFSTLYYLYDEVTLSQLDRNASKAKDIEMFSNLNRIKDFSIEELENKKNE